MALSEKLYTLREAAEVYFQGKVSGRELNKLFLAGELAGFRVGTGKGKILLYESGLDAYRLAHQNSQPASKKPEEPVPRPRLSRRRRDDEAGFVFFPYENENGRA